MDKSATIPPPAPGHPAIHPSLTFKRVFEAASGDEFTGFCAACGAETEGIEPDAREDSCEDCGAKRVYGAEQLLLETLFH